MGVSDRVCFSVNSVSASHGGRAVPQMMERLLPISLRWEPFLTSECLQMMPMMLCSRRNRQSTDVTGLLSWREEGSLAYKFNTEHQTDMSEIKEVLEDALRVSKDSQGAFDLTVLPLSQLWNFDRFGDSDFDVSTMEVPDQADIREAMKKVDYTQLRYNDETGILSTENTDIQIELGAIGKGYAIEQAKEILTSSDASGGMISAGSSIYVYGKKPDGSKFRVALRDPRGDENSAIGVLTLSDITISTSGDYERYFEKDGVRYHHILDPADRLSGGQRFDAGYDHQR